MLRFAPPFRGRYIASTRVGVTENIARVGVSVLTTCAAIVAHEGSATVSTSIGVSASGQQTDQQHFGTATVGVVISSTASGSATSTHSGTATASIVITTTAAGETGETHAGNANIGVTISATASGTTSQTHAGEATCQINLSASAAANVASYLYESDVLSISNNLLWLRADDIDGDDDKTDNPSDNTSISSWVSRNDGLTVSCTSGLEPTFQTNENGTLPAVKFDGTDELYVDWDSSMTNFTVFLVVKNYDSAAPGGYIMDGGQASASRLGWLDRSTGNFRMGGVANFSEVLSESGQSADTDWHIITAHYNGASSSLRVDLSAAASGDVGASNGTYSASEGIVIGGANHSNLYGSKILVAEVLAYSGALSTSDRDKVESYLNDKWSITTIHSGTASCQVNLSASASGSVSATYSNTYSLAFDSVNDYVDFGSGSGDIGTSPTSIVTWVKIADNNDIQTILSNRDATGGWSLEINTGLSGYTNITFYNRAVGKTIRCDFSTYDVWVNIIIVRNNIAGNKIYVNGVSQTLTVNNEQLQAVTPTNNLVMGGTFASGSIDRVINGKIDETAIIGSALTQANATAIYNSGTPIDLSSYSPINYWRMGDNDSGTGTTITDQGSDGNDGTLTNGPTFSTDIPS